MREMAVGEGIEVELKYCERCGGLWLRPRGVEEVYCASCAPKMAEFAGPGVTDRRGRPFDFAQGRRRPEVEGQCDERYAVCGEGGNA